MEAPRHSRIHRGGLDQKYVRVLHNGTQKAKEEVEVEEEEEECM
ncbi:hypothetical protein E2C01_086881 [Portunus trituberculatus]|uniref:Uncharacterized protein n=1 Tax=Portunus trituberculatus TaxID=210409 RepID=A0A5B7J205_PORTR|nr:hypothetical protein [Portunus trituberculatus]